MPKVYGRDACEVEQPDGELIPYIVVAVPATAPAGEWRAWTVTSPAGSTYRVSEPVQGDAWTCDCPAHTLGKNRGGRWKTINERTPVCKHVGAVYQWLAEQDQETGHADEAAAGGRPGERLPGTDGGGELPADERADAEAPHPVGTVSPAAAG